MRKAALIVLDGWGVGKEAPNNAIHHAHTPFFDHLWQNYPHTLLQASGTHVGLPEGQIGGSEVGHSTIGAGKKQLQDIEIVNKGLQEALSENELTNEHIRTFIEEARNNHPHIIGLFSPGGVHSHIEHIKLMTLLLKKHACLSPHFHIITDGRDTMPASARDYVAEFEQFLQKESERGQYSGIIDTLIGRFFAMDRDTNWHRTQKALDLYLKSQGEYYSCVNDALNAHYAQKITDEFIEACIVSDNFKGIPSTSPVLFMNFRKDRMTQLVSKMTQAQPHRSYFSLMKYSDAIQTNAFFEKDAMTTTLSSIIAEAGLMQLKVAESEKGPHVTYFFNGGRQKPYKNEIHSIIPSNTNTHDHVPEMKAKQISKEIQKIVEQEDISFILVNFANPDMVGHTGNWEAVVKGVEEVDIRLKELVEFLSAKGFVCFITADHGNADMMFDIETHEPHTAHTLNPVPFIVYSLDTNFLQQVSLVQHEDNSLVDVAGTILAIMDIPHVKHAFSTLLEN